MVPAPQIIVSTAATNAATKDRLLIIYVLSKKLNHLPAKLQKPPAALWDAGGSFKNQTLAKNALA
jgi:hypothetical protein